MELMDWFEWGMSAKEAKKYLKEHPFEKSTNRFGVTEYYWISDDRTVETIIQINDDGTAKKLDNYYQKVKYDTYEF